MAVVQCAGALKMRLTVHSNLRVRREKELIAHWVGLQPEDPRGRRANLSQWAWTVKLEFFWTELRSEPIYRAPCERQMPSPLLFPPSV